MPQPAIDDGCGAPGESVGDGGPAAAGDEAGDVVGSAGSDQESECGPPPRCEGRQIDLAPDEPDPKCIDGRQLNRLLADFEAAAAEETLALEQLADALDSLSTLNDQLDALQVRLGEVRLRLAGAQADARFAKIREAIAAEGLDDVTATLAMEEGRLLAQAVDAYVGGTTAELAATSAVPHLGSYAELETARAYAGAVLDRQVSTVQDVEALRGAVHTLTEVVAAIESSSEADADRVAVIQARVDEFVIGQRGLVTEAEVEAAAVTRRIAEIQTRKKAYAEQLRLTGVGGGAIGQLLTDLQADQQEPESTINLLRTPLDRPRVRSGFGPRVHPIFDERRLHTGIDLSASAGAPIMASADGVIVYAEETAGYGNVVVVDHGNTLATLYAHMTADAVEVGQQVLEGDLLGFVGSTGYSTGPHLHYEVRINGQPVDPLSFLQLD